MADEINGKPSLQMNTITIKLRKNVIANGDETDQLVFREPTAGDIEKYGVPVLIDMGHDPPKISFDGKSMTQMMAALATVPPSTIRQLHPKDWNTAAWNLASFFLPEL
jgi:hypothetical protein